MTKLWLILSAALLASGACRDTDKPLTDRDEGTGFRRPVESPDPTPRGEPGVVEDDFDANRETYSVETRSRLDRINARIDELEARTDAAAQDAAARLRARRDELAKRLDTTKSQAKDGWEEFKTETSRAFGELESELDAALR